MAEDIRTTQSFAHALLSPLTVVRGALDMLVRQSQDAPKHIRELLGLAQQQGLQLQEILNHLLATAQVDGDIVRITWSTAPLPAPRQDAAGTHSSGDPPDGTAKRESQQRTAAEE